MCRVKKTNKQRKKPSLECNRFNIYHLQGDGCELWPQWLSIIAIGLVIESYLIISYFVRSLSFSSLFLFINQSKWSNQHHDLLIYIQSFDSFTKTTHTHTQVGMLPPCLQLEFLTSVTQSRGTMKTAKTSLVLNKMELHRSRRHTH